jgi:hypothetical protein
MSGKYDELPMEETVLYGVRNGNEDWQEELLSTNPLFFEQAKSLAAKDGFGRFRVSVVNLRTPPDFRTALRGEE